MNTSIIIADDHPLMLRGLNDFLSSKGYNIVGSANDGKEAYNLIVKLNPTIAILDIRMPYKTGLEIAEECQKNNIDTKIILITFDKGEELYDRAKELNIYGYILKEFAIEEIETCIAHVEMNEPYFSEEINDYLNKSEIKAHLNALEKLTKSERKIVLLIAQDLDNQHISNHLNISLRTVEKHRSNIVSKLKLEKKPSSLFVWARLNKDFI